MSTPWTNSPDPSALWADGTHPESTLPSTEVLAPSMILSSINYVTPVEVSKIQENPRQFDDQWLIVVDDNDPSNVRINFQAPDSSQKVNQEGVIPFVVAVRKARAVAAGDPTLDLILWYQDAIVASIIGIVTVESEVGQLVTWDVPWSAFGVGFPFNPEVAQLAVIGVPFDFMGVGSNSVELGAASMQLSFKAGGSAWTQRTPANTVWS